ncbi:MAG: hypothetical protein ACYDGM_09920 [Vulcanimicrobiaceae bacterium]
MIPDSNDLVLMPEVQVRRLLRGRRLHLSILAPLGAWVGRGALRVLHVRPFEDDAYDVFAGYESYEPLERVQGAQTT